MTRSPHQMSLIVTQVPKVQIRFMFCSQDFFFLFHEKLFFQFSFPIRLLKNRTTGVGQPVFVSELLK